MENFKNTTISFNWKEAISSLMKKRENKKEKLMVEMTERLNYNLNPRKLRTNKVTAESTKRL